MYEHVRVCRECGEEYRPEIVRCADCGGELEDRRLGDVPAADQAHDPEPEAELEGHQVLFISARVTEVVPVAERLREVGIEHRLAEQPGPAPGAPPRYAILVRDQDARGALGAVTDLVAPHEKAEDVHAVETRFDRERGYLQCPACGAAPPAGARDCPECGLGLASEEAAEEPRE